jgi:hypothetical protein
LHRVEIDAVNDLPPLTRLKDQPGIHQGAKVMGKGRRGCPEMLANLADVQTVMACANKQAKDGQTGVVTKSSEGAGGFDVICHALNQNYKTSFVKMIRCVWSNTPRMKTPGAVTPGAAPARMQNA